MKTYVQLKDGVIMAQHQTQGEMDLSSENILEVDGSLGSYMYKKVSGDSFVDADKIRYAIIDTGNNNTVIGIRETYFSSEVQGTIITNPDVNILWTWDGSQFNAPVVEDPTPTVSVAPPEPTD
jgi:hypothetical protein